MRKVFVLVIAVMVTGVFASVASAQASGGVNPLVTRPCQVNKPINPL